MTLTDSPAYTVISSPRALVSYMRSTAHETEMMIYLAAWNRHAFRMAVSVPIGSASVYIAQHLTNGQVANAYAQTKLLLHSFFIKPLHLIQCKIRPYISEGLKTKVLSKSPDFGIVVSLLERTRNQPYAFQYSYSSCQMNVSLSTHTAMHLWTQVSLL